MIKKIIDDDYAKLELECDGRHGKISSFIWDKRSNRLTTKEEILYPCQNIKMDDRNDKNCQNSKSMHRTSTFTPTNNKIRETQLS